MPDTRREKYTKRWSALKLEREEWISHWQEIQDQILPRRGRFLTTERNRGTRLNTKIIDSTATLALRTLAAGLMGGLTSPSRPWFRLAPKDIALRDDPDVRGWLHEVGERMLAIFASSNIYNALPGLYEQIGAFGTGAMIVLEDMDTVIRSVLFPIGSFAVANGADGKVDTVYREFSMTVAQLVQEFGIDAVSSTVKREYERGNTEAWIEVMHVIEPNDDRIQDAMGADGMPWRSAWFEMATVPKADTSKFLRESGFEQFPVMAPRWFLTGEDVYGRSPGMDVLGDVKQLQHEQKRKAQAIDKVVNPPMTAPSALKVGDPANTMPGGITYVDDPGGQAGFRPAYEVPPQIAQRREEILELQHRIKRGLFEDLFLMFATTDRREITAREIDERAGEKLLQLGPTLERLEAELLDPLIDRTFAIMVRNELVPEAPEILEGEELKVEYISVLAQAQQQVGVGGIDRLITAVGGMAQLDPTVLDKVDMDEVVDELAQMLGVPPSVVREADAVEQLRGQRRAVAAMQQMPQMAKDGAQAAKAASETNVDERSGLTRAQEILTNLSQQNQPVQ